MTNVTKNYQWNGFSHHALTAKSIVTVMFAKRDVNLLAIFGINEAFIADFETKIQKLKAVSTYSTDKANKVLSTVLREDVRNVLYMELKKVRKRVSMVLPTTSEAYKQHMSGKLSKTSLEEFIKTAERIVEGLKIYSAQLVVLGIDEEFISTLENQIVDFTNVMANDKFIKETSDDNTVERAKAMDAVYSDLSKLCKAGKALWEDDNLARYKDYIIHKKRTKSGTETETDTQSDDIYEELESLS